jgi:hypothetical protein
MNDQLEITSNRKRYNHSQKHTPRIATKTAKILDPPLAIKSSTLAFRAAELLPPCEKLETPPTEDALSAWPLAPMLTPLTPGMEAGVLVGAEPEADAYGLDPGLSPVARSEPRTTILSETWID